MSLGRDLFIPNSLSYKISLLWLYTYTISYVYSVPYTLVLEKTMEFETVMDDKNEIVL